MKDLEFYAGYLLKALQSALELGGSNEIGFAFYDRRTPELYTYYDRSYTKEYHRLYDSDAGMWKTYINGDPTCKDIDTFVSQIIQLREGITYDERTLSGYGNILVSMREIHESESGNQINFEFYFGDLAARTELMDINNTVVMIEPDYDDRSGGDFQFTFSNGEIKPLDDEE